MCLETMFTGCTVKAILNVTRGEASVSPVGTLVPHGLCLVGGADAVHATVANAHAWRAKTCFRTRSPRVATRVERLAERLPISRCQLAPVCPRRVLAELWYRRCQEDMLARQAFCPSFGICDHSLAASQGVNISPPVPSATVSSPPRIRYYTTTITSRKGRF